MFVALDYFGTLVREHFGIQVGSGRAAENGISVLIVVIIYRAVCSFFPDGRAENVSDCALLFGVGFFLSFGRAFAALPVFGNVVCHIIGNGVKIENKSALLVFQIFAAVLFSLYDAVHIEIRLPEFSVVISVFFLTLGKGRLRRTVVVFYLYSVSGQKVL